MNAKHLHRIYEEKWQSVGYFSGKYWGYLSMEEKNKLFRLLHAYADTVASSISDLGQTNKLKHHTVMGDAVPI